MSGGDPLIMAAENIIKPGYKYRLSNVVENTIWAALKKRVKPEIIECGYPVLPVKKAFTKNNIFQLVPGVLTVQAALLAILKFGLLPKRIRVLDIGAQAGVKVLALLDLVSVLDKLAALMGREKVFRDIVIDVLDVPPYLGTLQENLVVFKKEIEPFFASGEIPSVNCINGDINGQWLLGDKYDLIVIKDLFKVETGLKNNILAKACEHLHHKGIIMALATFGWGLFSKFKCEVREQDLAFFSPWICDKLQTALAVETKIFQYLRRKGKDAARLKWQYAVFAREPWWRGGVGKGSQYVVNQDCIVCDRTEDQVEPKMIARCEATLNTKQRQDETYQGQGTGIYNRKQHATIMMDSKDKDERSLLFFLKRFWGFNSFQPGQYSIIRRALSGKDVLGILSTGAGKSICFQLPAMLGPGTSIVVSPLKSLMKDQVRSLHNNGIDCVDYIDGSRTAQEKKMILSKFKNNHIKLLYITPERLQLHDFQAELKSASREFPIDFFIIDEAHCASEWGHDFRPSYLKLKDILPKLGNPVVIAVTATASQRVKEDILDIFSLAADNVFKGVSLDRAEISWQVVKIAPGEEKIPGLKDVLFRCLPEVLGKENLNEVHKEGSGLIFAVYARPEGKSTYIAGTEYIQKVVQGWGIKANVYHSKLSDEQRGQIQDGFIEDRFPLLVATKGFGMGIDKPNIDYIIHTCFPNSLEAYYQEAGRAGRGGKHAHAVILARIRHPRCKGWTKKGPPCINGWNCRYTGTEKCDYGMQAKFIDEQYPSDQESRINVFLKAFINKSEGRLAFIYDIKAKNVVEYQRYLYHLQRLEIVQDYVTIAYPKKQDIKLRVTLKEIIQAHTVLSIAKRVAECLVYFKKQKINMLESMWRYIDNEDICRRDFLMSYFGEKTGYRGGCGFCDVEGISFMRAALVNPELRCREIYKNIEAICRCREFDYYRLEKELKHAYEENIQVYVQIRAMKVLEDYPDNLPALYLAGIIALEENPRDERGAEQMKECISQLKDRKCTKILKRVMGRVLGIDREVCLALIIDCDLLSELGGAVWGQVSTEEKKILYLSYLQSKMKLYNNLIGRFEDGFGPGGD